MQEEAKPTPPQDPTEEPTPPVVQEVTQILEEVAALTEQTKELQRAATESIEDAQEIARSLEQAAEELTEQDAQAAQGVTEDPEQALEAAAESSAEEIQQAATAPEAMQEEGVEATAVETPAKPKRSRKPKAATPAPAQEGLSDEEILAESPKQEQAEETIPFVMEEVAFASAVEAILFATEKPASLNRLRDAFAPMAPTDEQLEAVIATIQTRYQEEGRGFHLRRAQGGYHFVTKMENAEYIRKFQASKPFRLGRSALEVLAIIAYRQPITRAEIDQVRGIDSSHLLRTLIERGLVKMAGKAEVPGRPVQYGTTEKFLEVVGLSSPGELPPLSELTQLQGDAEDPQKRMEAGLDNFMKPLASSEFAPLEDEEGQDPVLGEIESLIQTADHAPKEVFASAVHREVALANQEALEAFQAASRRRPRKQQQAADDEVKTITFEELTGGGSGGNTEGGSTPPPLSN